MLEYTLCLKTNEHINNLDSIEVYADFELPETLKEFRVLHGLGKEDLLDWLNENYKK